MTDFTSAALLPLSYTGNKRTSLTKADHKLSCAIPVWQFSPLMSWSRVQTTAGAALACLPRRRGSRVLRASSANHPRHRHQHIKLAVPTLHPLWLCFAPLRVVHPTLLPIPSLRPASSWQPTSLCTESLKSWSPHSCSRNRLLSASRLNGHE